MTFKEVNPDIFKFENKGDSLEGVLVKKAPGKYPDSQNYTLKTEDGLKVIFGSTILDDRMALIEIADTIRITYEGTKDSDKGKNPTKLFKVEKDFPDGEVPDSAEDAAEEAEEESE